MDPQEQEDQIHSKISKMKFERWRWMMTIMQVYLQRFSNRLGHVLYRFNFFLIRFWNYYTGNTSAGRRKRFVEPFVIFEHCRGSTQKWMMNQFGPNGLNGVCRDLTHLDGLNQIDCIVFEIASDPSLIIMEKVIINAPEIFMKSNKTISR